MNRIDEFLDMMVQVAEKPIPEHVLHRTKLALLDYIGVTLAGRREHGIKADRLADSFCGGGWRFACNYYGLRYDFLRIYGKRCGF